MKSLILLIKNSNIFKEDDMCEKWKRDNFSIVKGTNISQNQGNLSVVILKERSKRIMIETNRRSVYIKLR